MTKLLDLDSILPPKKSIKFGGQEYPIVEMTVGLFVSIKQMEGKDLQNMSPVEQVTAYADLVRKGHPIRAGRCTGKTDCSAAPADLHLRYGSD